MAVALSASSSHQQFSYRTYTSTSPAYTTRGPSSYSSADVPPYSLPLAPQSTTGSSFGRYQEERTMERNTNSTLSLEAIASFFKQSEEVDSFGDLSPPLRSYGFSALREQNKPKKRKAKSFPRISTTTQQQSALVHKAKPPVRRSRSVRFADTQGLPLERIRPLTSADPFQTEGEIVPSLANDLGALTIDKTPSPQSSPGTPKRSNTHKNHARHFKFSQPGTQPHFYQRLQRLKVSLESIKSENRALHGIVRTLNLSFEKHVCIRWTHDNWKSYHDTLCAYCPGSSSDGHTDRFSFTIPVNGDDIQFAVLYRMPDGSENWDNNDSQNYIVVARES